MIDGLLKELPPADTLPAVPLPHAISDVSGLRDALDGKQPTLPYKITVSTTEPRVAQRLATSGFHTEVPNEKRRIQRSSCGRWPLLQLPRSRSPWAGRGELTWLAIRTLTKWRCCCMDGADGGTVFTDSSAAPKNSGAIRQSKNRYSAKQVGRGKRVLRRKRLKTRSPVRPALGVLHWRLYRRSWVFSLPATGGGVGFDKLIFGGFQGDPDFSCFLNNFNLAPALWNGSIAYESQIVVPPNTWTHVAWCRASGILRIFVNGQKGVEVSMPTTFQPRYQLHWRRSN